MRSVEIALLVLGVLLAMAQHSMAQLSSKNPNLIRRHPLGIIFTSSELENEFLRDVTDIQHVNIKGRTFATGEIFKYPVVCVTSGDTPSVNVGITAEIMAVYFGVLQHFELEGIIGVGLAGATNESIELGSVVVNKDFAFTGAWDWLNNDSKMKGELNIGDYNYPVAGENLLGSIKFEPSQIYTPEGIVTNISLSVDIEWLGNASKVQVPGAEVIVGLNGSSSDIYVENSAYGEFLYKTFRVSTVDTYSFALGLAAYANNLSFIAFQGISNDAGAGSGATASELAKTNVVKAVISFIRLITPDVYEY